MSLSANTQARFYFALLLVLQVLAPLVEAKKGKGGSGGGGGGDEEGAGAMTSPNALLAVAPVAVMVAWEIHAILLRHAAGT
ncbi:hypothetical protein EJ05DRAFT_496682 [Pseudovirgaria hyperparasitica]|uniref:Uncharacterized protein n=1 Tax=Pseudovirgaria hyperparasitica TaxID=470096 RepID=A0A6A6WG67_9PEZI|nr:uncharacterized protein EJ05DRAFT_496682 [Pseudovirgaria hyperparasitica]KAF2761788.1 hypothetical protein EJ05DRAFT_496682 [Pseudovirgaria hyperparasitica]